MLSPPALSLCCGSVLCAPGTAHNFIVYSVAQNRPDVNNSTEKSGRRQETSHRLWINLRLAGGSYVSCSLHHAVRFSLSVPHIGCARPQSCSCGGTAMPSADLLSRTDDGCPTEGLRLPSRRQKACCAPSTETTCALPRSGSRSRHTASLFITPSRTACPKKRRLCRQT